MTPVLAMSSNTLLVLTNIAIVVLTGAAVFLGWRPLKAMILQQEDLYDRVLRRRLLWQITPRVATVVAMMIIALLGAIGYIAADSYVGAILCGAAGVFVPPLLLSWLQRRHLGRLEDQLVPGIQTLASGVRAGLNLVQSMQLLGRDGPTPLRQEMDHLLREYEYGISLEDAMDNAAYRIGSSDYRLLFAALQTHRERGGDLGKTLDRIAESIREIQRLEKRVETLTAQGRATARWLGAMPIVVLLILYFLVDPQGVQELFQQSVGKIMLLAMLVLNVIGFLWIRKIMDVDI